MSKVACPQGAVPVFPEIAESLSDLLLRLEQNLKQNGRHQFNQNCCFLDWTELAVALEQNSRFSLVYQVNAPFRVSTDNGFLCVYMLWLTWLISRMTSPLMAGVHGKKMLSFCLWPQKTPLLRFYRCSQGIVVDRCCIGLYLMSCAGSAACSFQNLASLSCFWFLVFVLLSYHKTLVCL